MSKRFWTLLAASLCAAAACSADVRPPDSRPRPARRVPAPSAVSLQVIPLGKGQGTRIELPRQVLQELGAGAVQAQPSSGSTPLGAGTVIAGLALSLALALGGLWLARRRPRLAPVVTAGLLLAAGGAGLLAGRSQANVPPPVRPEPKPGPGQLNLNAQVVLVEGGDSVRLFIAPERLAGLQAPGKSASSGEGAPPPSVNPPVTRK